MKNTNKRKYTIKKIKYPMSTTQTATTPKKITKTSGYPKHITAEEERELIKDFQENKSKDALEKLMKAHTPYLQHSAAKAHKQFAKAVEYEDLVQQARIGLIRAAQDFDLNKKVEDVNMPTYGKHLRFLTYAHRWIWSAMQEAWHLSPPVHIPAHTLRQINFEKKTLNEHGEYVAEPTTPKNDFRKRIARLSIKAESLDVLTDTSKISDKSNNNQFSELRFSVNENNQDPTFEETSRTIYGPLIQKAINKLTEIEWKVFSLRNGIETGQKLKLKEVANQLNLSEIEVDKMFKKAKRILTKMIPKDYSKYID